MVKKTVYGEKVDFKSLSCAPINELGVVYLFGVLHEAFDFKIELIRARFPDCIARRKVSSDRWEEWRIEFEYNSKSFLSHKHDPAKVDMIICWKHDWPDCPTGIEVIELSSFIKDGENIIKDKKKLTAWNKFCSIKRKEGLTFTEIAQLWRKEKGKSTKKKRPRTKAQPSEYQQFLQKQLLEGKTFKEVGKLWREMKSKEKT